MVEKLTWVLLTTALCCGACERRERHDQAGKPLPPTNQSTDTAVNAIAHARCEREERCQSIGKGKTFKDVADCNATLSEHVRTEINAGECPSGVNKEKLTECLDAIRKEACGKVVDELVRINACGGLELCKEAPRS
ncbi:MAG: hypothetical protein HOW73_28715 [Polyangiaceae bacterium]|nr:hypothetical protein [Polyangiaceae bacterium]